MKSKQQTKAKDEPTTMTANIVGIAFILGICGYGAYLWRSNAYKCTNSNQTGTQSANVADVPLTIEDLQKFAVDYCDTQRVSWDALYAGWQTQFTRLNAIINDLNKVMIDQSSWENVSWWTCGINYGTCVDTNFDKFSGNYGPMAGDVTAANAVCQNLRAEIIKLDTAIKAKKPLCKIEFKKTNQS